MRNSVVVVVVFVAALVGCTKPNPNVCCATEAQCAELGVDDLRPCDVGQACAPDHACVAAECSVTQDCTSPEAPICSNGLCVGTCTSNDDCADVLGRPVCSPDGACVGCIDASHCASPTSICDSEEHACRGCERDDECASGVCIEADGVCADESRLIFVASSSQVDTGTCTRSAPCASIEYALMQVTSTRDVVRVVGGMLFPTPITINRGVVLDGNGIRLVKPYGSPTVTITGGGVGAVTLEGVAFDRSGGDTGMTIRVANGATVRVARETTIHGPVEVVDAALSLQDASLADGETRCTNGALYITRTAVTDARVVSTSCNLSIAQSRFDKYGDGFISATGGLVVVENNLFVQGYELADSLAIRSVAPTSAFRFNTVVNVSGVDSDGVALFCDATLGVTSNVFAYASKHPMGPPGGADPPCGSRYSLFDVVAVPEHSSGERNLTAAWADIFEDVLAGNFTLRLAGIDAAESNLGVSADLFGRPRGEQPDIGAVERQ